jgi:hypothetical protein
MVLKLASTLSLIESAYFERNNSNEHHEIGLLSLFKNTSLSVFCSNDPYLSTSSVRESLKKLIMLRKYIPLVY